MVTMQLQWIFLIYCFGLLFILCQKSLSVGVCGPPNGTSMNCCSNFYQKGNACVECGPGYTGMNCSQSCPMNYYGRLCRYKCDCSPDQYCDHVRGCLCNITSVNCTDEVVYETGQEYSSVSTLEQYGTEVRPGKRYTFKMLVPSFLLVLALLTMFTVLGRIWYKSVIEKSKDSLVKEQTMQENDTSNEENDLATAGIYNHLNLRIRNSLVTLYNSRRELADEMTTPQLSSEPHLFITCQQKKENTSDKDINGYERYVEMDFDRDKHKETTIIESNLCKHDVSNETFYSNATQRMQKSFSNSDVRVSHRPTRSHTDTFNLNERQLPRSAVDTRPDRSVVSEVSDDLYFDVSYSLQLTPRGTKYNNSPYPPSSPTPEKKDGQRTPDKKDNQRTPEKKDGQRTQEKKDGLRIDANSSTEHRNDTTESRNSARGISSNRRSLSCGDLLSKMEGKLFPNARSESPVSSEISDELNINTSHPDQSRSSCDQFEDSQRSIYRYEFEDDKIDYVNCGNLV